MLREANKFCVRLWKDESGVVLALAVVVFLTLFVLACAVYAVGENVRQRIEIQNAADAAAYSAAIVQADAVSRIAAINRAMGWTYIDLGKRQMDVIVDEWLRLVRDKWQPDYDKSERHNHRGCGHYNDHYAGDSGNRRHVFLNGRAVPFAEIEAAINAFNGRRNQVRNQIDLDRTSISSMNSAEDEIISSLQRRIYRTVREILKKNIEPTGLNDARFAVMHDASKCFGGQGESSFFRSLFGGKTDPNAIFGSGAGNWYNVRDADGGGFYRRYEQQGKVLVATWEWYGNRWKWRPHSCGPNCVYWRCDNVGNIIRGNNRVTGEDARPRNEPYFEMVAARPRILTPDYFGAPGAIVVAVARRMQNPFINTFGDLGIFTAFNPMNGSTFNPTNGLPFNPTNGASASQYTWSVAAARAGYREKEGRDGEGGYNPTCDSFQHSRDELDVDPTPWKTWREQTGWLFTPNNLTLSDWDAVLLPVSRAWSSRTPAWQNRSRGTGIGHYSVGEWDANRGSEILNQLWRAETWVSLKGFGDIDGLVTRANRFAPPEMDAGGEINYSTSNMELNLWH